MSAIPLTIESVEATLAIDPHCENCTHYKRERGHVLFVMAPGADGKEWYLCFRCWLEGASRRLADNEVPPKVKAAVIVEPPKRTPRKPKS